MDTSPRKEKYKEALKAILEPGDVVLVVCKDDSRTMLLGKNYRDVYAQGRWSPRYQVWSVLLGVKILGELLDGNMRLCMPGVQGEVTEVELTKEQAEQFLSALKAGTLQPSDSFPVVAAAYKELIKVLEGHFAACAPTEYRQIQLSLANPPDQRLFGPDGNLVRGGRPS